MSYATTHPGKRVRVIDRVREQQFVERTRRHRRVEAEMQRRMLAFRREALVQYREDQAVIKLTFWQLLRKVFA